MNEGWHVRIQSDKRHGLNRAQVVRQSILTNATLNMYEKDMRTVKLLTASLKIDKIEVG